MLNNIINLIIVFKKMRKSLILFFHKNKIQYNANMIDFFNLHTQAKG